MGEKKTRRLSAIMFADMVGYSAMMHANEQEGRIKATRFRQVLQRFVEEHGGKVVQHYGDGSLTIFSSAVEAMECAQKVQLTLKEAPQVPLRVGIHIGDIVVDGEEIFGDGVNIAARVESMGVPGAILVTERVYFDLKSHPEFKMASLGFFEFKNIEKPMEVFALANEGFTVPQARDMKGKGRAVDSSWVPRNIRKVILPLLFLGAIGFWVFINQEKLAEIAPGIKEARIAVPSFQNFTLVDSLEILGKMASHWITKGLSESNAGAVVDYETAISRPEVLSGSMENRNQYSLVTGAVNILEGSYSLYGRSQDSLVFTALIKDLKSGAILYTFPDQYSSRLDPLQALNQLSGRIQGYWASKEAPVTSIPTYNAYRAFLTAKEIWNQDLGEAEKQLLTAIRLDSTFIDPYFLLLPIYRYQERNSDIQKVIDLLRSKSQMLSLRQKNLIDHSEAILNGENKRAYGYYLKEYELNPNDLFNNTSAMVYALEYVNAPEKAIDFFNEIPVDSLDLNNCSYCVERVYVAMLAHMKAGDYRGARNLAGRVPRDSPLRGYYIDMARVFAHFKDTSEVNRIINTARSLKLSQDYRFIYYQVAEHFTLEGNKAMMTDYAQKVVDLNYNKRSLARAYILLQEYDAARQVLEELLLEDPAHIQNWGHLGVVYTKQGNTGLAQQVLDELGMIAEESERGMIAYEEAKIFAHLGNEQTALNKLEESVDKGLKFFFWRFENDPDFLILRENPQFQQIIHPLEYEKN